MAVMHLRLEHPDTMVVRGTPMEASNGKTSSTHTTTLCVVPSSEGQAAEGSDASSEEADAVKARKLSIDSSAEELHRVPSMNLATDPTLWVGDATLSHGAPGRKTSDGGGGINPFDSSSEEDEDDDAAQVCVAAGRGDTEGGDLDTSLEASGRRPLAKGGNPFDLSFFDSKETAAAEATACGRGGGIESTPGDIVLAEEVTVSEAAVFPTTNTDLSGSRSSRISKVFPVGQIVPAIASTPSSAEVASAETQETAWPATIDHSITPNADQLLLTSGVPPRVQTLDLAIVESLSTVIASPPSPIDSTDVCFTNKPPLPFPPAKTTTAAESGVVKAPRDKCLPPTPLLAFGAGGAYSSPCSTPPVTPFALPLAKTPAEIRDGADVPSPSASQELEGLFSAFRDTTEAAPPPALNKEQADLFSAFRDRTETPASLLPSKSEMELHLAFRDKPEDSPPPACPPALPQPGLLQPEEPKQSDLPERCGVLDEADSSKIMQDFNPFGRPGSFVLSQTPAQTPTEEPPLPPGKVRRSPRSTHPLKKPDF